MNATKYLTVFNLILVLASCTIKPHKNKNLTDNKTADSFENLLPEQEYITDPKEKKIISYNDTLYKGDTLKIKFKTPHPKDFAILGPDNHFYYVINSDDDFLMPSLMVPEKFESTEWLEIITDQTKISPYDARINHNVIAFTKTGQYELWLSDVLCTDDGTPLEVETVYYINKPRKK